MNNILEKMDSGLWNAIEKSGFKHIDYEHLLATDPARIRLEEDKVSAVEKPIKIPEKIVVENKWIPSSDPSVSIRVRIYRPKDQKHLPVCLYFHGGSFIYGTPEQYDFLFFRLVSEVNMLIISVDYSLAPEHPFPAAIKDGYDVLLWTSRYAATIGGDNKNIMIGGSSAGATIAASITQWARDRKEIAIQHQYLMYPPMSNLLDTASMQELSNAPLQTKKAAAWMWKHYLQNTNDSLYKYAVPLLQNTFENLPEATLIVCELDPLKDEGIMYAEKLKNAGVSVNLIEIKGAVHTFEFFDCALSENFYKLQIELFKKIID